MLRQQELSVELPPPMQVPATPELVWQNTLLASASFRRAHVERFEIPDRFAVLHVCVLPHLTEPTPIFGFDMVAGRLQATGIFLDFSPVTDRSPVLALGDILRPDVRARFTDPRPKPTWGKVFSDDFFAIRPSSATEIMAAVAIARDALVTFIARLAAQKPDHACGRQPVSQVVEGQAAYATAQRQNPHTLRMLARHIGMAAARNFIDDVLFPMPA